MLRQLHDSIMYFHQPPVGKFRIVILGGHEEITQGCLAVAFGDECEAGQVGRDVGEKR
jgi:hypothetical protein